MFYLIGLGLGDYKDVTVKGLEIIKKCTRVYLDAYTSILTCGIDALEEYYERKIIQAFRDEIECGADEILENADIEDVALLVVGDPFGATTHTDIVQRAKTKGIKYKVVHNASILTAVGCCGLQLYSFGETVSIPYWNENWRPDSFYDKILANYQRNLHTLCLLDIKVKEPTEESLCKKVKQYLPPRFMSCSEAAQQILEIIKQRQDSIKLDSLCIGLARVGSDNQKIIACSLEEMSRCDLGAPLHCLVIPGGDLHPHDEEYLQHFKV